MFSRTTTESSISMPMLRVSAIIDMMLSVKPSCHIAKKLAITDVGDVGRRAELAARLHHDLARAQIDAAAGQVEALSMQCRRELRDRNAVGVERAAIDLHADLTDGAAVDGDGADAVDALELLLD